MNKLYFFSDVSLLKEQTISQTYGPVFGNESYQYNVTSKHSFYRNAELYAVCNSKYAVIKQSNKRYTFVLQPKDKYLFPGLSVSFFVYRNVSLNQLNEDKCIANTDDEFILLSELFDNSLYTSKIYSIDAGQKIGFVNSDDEFEFGILLDNVFSKHYLKTIVIGNISILIQNNGISDSYLIKKEKRDREEILNYIDPAAFFSKYKLLLSFYKDGKIYHGGDADFYYNLLNKFGTKNVIYVDIRDQKGTSFNYYRSDIENIRLNIRPLHSRQYNNLDSSSNKNYETFGWPIFILKIDSLGEKDIQENGCLSICISCKTSNDNVFLYSATSDLCIPIYEKKGDFRFYMQNLKIFSLGKQVTDNWSNDYILKANIINREFLPTYYKLYFIEKNASIHWGDSVFMVDKTPNQTKNINSSMQEKFLSDENILNGMVFTGCSWDLNETRITFFAEYFSLCEKPLYLSIQNLFYLDLLKNHQDTIWNQMRMITCREEKNKVLKIIPQKERGESFLYSFSISKDEYFDIQDKIKCFDTYLSPVFVKIEKSGMLNENLGWRYKLKLVGILKENEFVNQKEITMDSIDLFSLDSINLFSSKASSLEKNYKSYYPIKIIGFDVEKINNILAYLRILRPELYFELERVRGTGKIKQKKNLSIIGSEEYYSGLTKQSFTPKKDFILSTESFLKYIEYNLNSKPNSCSIQEDPDFLPELLLNDERVSLNEIEDNLVVGPADIKIPNHKDFYTQELSELFDGVYVKENVTIADYNYKLFSEIHLLAHELGHYLYYIQHSAETYCWAILEEKLKKEYPSLKFNQGHLLGEPDGIRACEEDYKTCRAYFDFFTKKWEQEFHKRNIDDSQILKYNKLLACKVYNDGFLLPSMNEWYPNYSGYCKCKYLD